MKLAHIETEAYISVQLPKARIQDYDPKYRIGTYLKYLRNEDYVDVIKVFRNNPMIDAEFLAWVLVHLFHDSMIFSVCRQEHKSVKIQVGRVVSPFNDGCIITEDASIGLDFDGAAVRLDAAPRDYSLVARTFAEAWETNGYFLPDLGQLLVAYAAMEHKHVFRHVLDCIRVTISLGGDHE